MNETFHPFPKLPAELRLCIWEMMVRPTGPNRPGVHFFGIQQSSENSRYCFTTLPVFPQISQQPWKQKNPSSYFSDFGMWMACKESRAVVTSRLARRYEGRAVRYRDAIKLRHGQEEIKFGIDRQDLVCMQIPDPGVSGRSNLWSSFHLDFNVPLKDAWYVAFEYDASWSFSDWEHCTVMDMIIEEGPRGAFLRTLDEVMDCNLSCCLYLIQYGAKTKPGKSTVEVFYGDGFHLALANEDDVEVEGPSGVMNAWKFIYEVNNWGDNIWKDRRDAVDWHCSMCESVITIPALHVDVLIYEEA